MASIREQEKKDIENALANAQKKVAAQDKKIEDQQKKLNDAIAEQALICAEAKDSEACAAAKKKVEAAQTALNDAKEEKNSLQDKVGELEGQKADADEAYNAAAEAKKGLDEQRAAEAEAEARKERERIANELCEKHGEDSPECMEARDKIDNPNSTKKAVYGHLRDEKITGFNYGSSADKDVFEMVTRRAAVIILNIKPIVYIIAGFGLIAFAWGAIFNKISWRHFANIAIGLFLVANMGRFIEYFVGGSDKNYYIGQWESSTPKQNDSDRLAAAFQDSYQVYGYSMKEPIKTEDNDIAYEMYLGEVTVTAQRINPVKEEMKKRGYCQGDGGFFSSLKNCVADVTGTIKKAANAVQTTIATVNHVKNRAESIVNSAKAIKNTLKNMGGNGIAGVMNDLTFVMSNIDNIKDSTNSAISGIDHGITTVMDNVTTLGDTNKNPSGKVTTNLSQAFGAIGNTAAVIENMKPKGKSSGGSGVGKASRAVVGGDTGGRNPDNSTGSNNSNTGDSSAGSSNNGNAGDASQTPQPQTSKDAQKAYTDNINKTNNMYTDIKNQEKELDNYKKEVEQVEKAKNEACKAGENSPSCQLHTSKLNTAQQMVANAENKLNTTRSEYATVKAENDKLYNQKLEIEQQEAQQAAKSSFEAKEKTCSEDPMSDACMKAMKNYQDATDNLLKINSTKESGSGVTKTYEDQEIQKQQTREEQELQKQQYREEQERKKQLDSYEAAHTPQKIAQDAYQAYNGLLNEMDDAQSEYNKLSQEAKGYKKDYETASKKAEASKDPTDIAEAQRLKEIYEDKQMQAGDALENYKTMKTKEFDAHKLYLEKAIIAEEDTQSKLKKERADLSSTISQLNASGQAKFGEVEQIAKEISAAEAKVDKTEDDEIAIVALRDEYNKLSGEYNRIKSDLQNAKSKQRNAEAKLDTSIKNLNKFEEELEKLNRANP